MKKSFDDFIKQFKETIIGHKDITDFVKVWDNTLEVEIQLKLLEVLIGKKDNFDEEFKFLIKKYPDIISVIPILLALRIDVSKNGAAIVKVFDEFTKIVKYYDFSNKDFDIDELLDFVKRTGIKKMLTTSGITSLKDYVMGVEVGLDSNARKNRVGKIMEEMIRNIFSEKGYLYEEKKSVKKIVQWLESNSEKKTFKFFNWKKDFNFNLDELKSILNNDDKTFSDKVFDFVIYFQNHLFFIEVNFYSSSGSKPNEVTKSYLHLSEFIKKFKNTHFIWITDGYGWLKTLKPLENVFKSDMNIFSLYDLEDKFFDEFISSFK